MSMTYDLDFDLDMVKMNQHDKCLC